MPKYINPNNTEVTLDLGSPSRRNVTLRPYGSVHVPGDTRKRVIEMTDQKASFYASIGMITKLAANAPEQKNEPDLDVTELEEQARGIISRRYPERGQPNQAAIEQEARRQQVETERKQQEQKELAEAAIAKEQIAQADARRQERADAERGIVPAAKDADAGTPPTQAAATGPVETAPVAPVVTGIQSASPAILARRAQQGAANDPTKVETLGTDAKPGVASFGCEGDGSEDILGKSKIAE